MKNKAFLNVFYGLSENSRLNESGSLARARPYVLFLSRVPFTIPYYRTKRQP